MVASFFTQKILEESLCFSLLLGEFYRAENVLFGRNEWNMINYDNYCPTTRKGSNSLYRVFEIWSKNIIWIFF